MSQILAMHHNQETNQYEIGVDEAGRGPMFGRLYVAAVVLPKDGSFNPTGIKDSKKITSHKKIKALSEYIQEKALAWHIGFVEADIIDQINIRQAVLSCMRECIREVTTKIMRMDETLPHDSSPYQNKFFLLIDGNDFLPYVQFDENTQSLKTLPHETFEKGDNIFVAIAAASILAKVARDAYVCDLCEKHPDLILRYSLNKNMGYGTKKHLEGIDEHGITQWHRRTFGRCKDAKMNPIVG